MAKAALTPEERAALNERLAKARVVVAANRAAAAEQREISQIQAQARFAPAPTALPERDQDLARARAAAIQAAEQPPPLMPPIVHEGDVAPAIVGEPPAEDPRDADLYGPVEDEPEEVPLDNDFERFLAAQDAETREVLSDVELRVIFETETKRAQEERKAATRKAATARALRHAKATAGLLPAEAVAAAALRDRLAQKVEWTVNMPEAGNSGMLIDEGIRINGRLMRHGERVAGTLAEYESYRAIEWNAHQNELDFQGRGKMSKLRQTATGFLNMRGAT